MKGWIKA